jgi:hypothetical protein
MDLQLRLIPGELGQDLPEIVLTEVKVSCRLCETGCQTFVILEDVATLFQGDTLRCITVSTQYFAYWAFDPPVVFLRKHRSDSFYDLRWYWLIPPELRGFLK